MALYLMTVLGLTLSFYIVLLSFNLLYFQLNHDSLLRTHNFKSKPFHFHILLYPLIIEYKDTIIFLLHQKMHVNRLTRLMLI